MGLKEDAVSIYKGSLIRDKLIKGHHLQLLMKSILDISIPVINDDHIIYDGLYFLVKEEENPSYLIPEFIYTLFVKGPKTYALYPITSKHALGKILIEEGEK